ncbi:signal peptidase I [Natronomonas sp. CBA1123]|uniref:signal peptidase I n=1 Tax=Natronomonas sp. CBA1123 TaxID=2668070 RepID=UPI0012EA9710|nr:signal peptidase I [Natronomonas sp. CBA1123]MUV87370.1 signal peptidase I [Natronomonas sp. CBA1123]
MTDETTTTEETATSDTQPERESAPEKSSETTTSGRARRIAAVLGFVLLVALVVPFVVFAVPQTIGADHGFVVLSGSMEPAISPGDVVIVASGPVTVGDVITYRTGNEVPTTHRIVEEVDGAYRTKGDANENADAGLVAPEQVLGSVIVIIPLIGYVILWANTTLGFVLLVVVPLVLLGGMEVYRFLRDPEEEYATATAATDGGASVSDGSSPAEGATDAETNSSETSPQKTVEVAGFDLTLTFWVLLAFAAYAGYVLFTEVSRTGVPSAVGVGVFTGALVGFLLVAALVGRERLRTRRQDAEPVAVTDPDADGTPGGD